MKPDAIWSMILAEEIGELSEDSLNQKTDHAKVESIQIAAVANAWAEAIHERGALATIPHEYVIGEPTDSNFDILEFFVAVGKMSKAILEETRRLMAARRRPGIQTLADHQVLRAFHKARSRQLAEDAREKQLTRQDRSAARNASVNFSRS